MAGRPSKLSDRQWGEIGRRLANGEGTSKLAREFKVAASTISERFSKRVDALKDLATAIVETDKALAILPNSERSSVMSMVDNLKATGNSLASAAKHGSAVSDRLAMIARHQADRLTLDATPDEVRPIAALATTAETAGRLGHAMIQAAKTTRAVEGDSALFTPAQILAMAREIRGGE
jgi:hypothetical protein